ncbi:hypothetical protein F2Q68_00033005 [Brassica cretica]|uniref:Uncharacterized protein n=1 Tax=Brassica cretica TaxID=69181 RepID=A0A8S9G5Q0_BRACR|nr:hypothetical protein F2Q68_00033005 [Brassica cretica]
MERVREPLHPSLRRLRSRSGGRLMDSVLEADLFQVAEVMGLEEDMMMLEKQMSILASSSELKQNPSIRRLGK